jgi:hypothetical protein
MIGTNTQRYGDNLRMVSNGITDCTVHNICHDLSANKTIKMYLTILPHLPTNSLMRNTNTCWSTSSHQQNFQVHLWVVQEIPKRCQIWSLRQQAVGQRPSHNRHSTTSNDCTEQGGTKLTMGVCISMCKYVCVMEWLCIANLPSERTPQFAPSICKMVTRLLSCDNAKLTQWKWIEWESK